MEIVSGLNYQAAGSSLAGELIAVVESPVVGKQKTTRRTSTRKSAEDGRTIAVQIEEHCDGKLTCRHTEQYLPSRSSTRELFEKDGTLISAETERRDETGLLTKIVIRGSGKSSTTRVTCGDVEARATERSVLIETPRASYCYQAFEGRWTSYYKEIDAKFEMRAHSRGPDSTLDGPDGIKLVFRGGRLADMFLTQNSVSIPRSSNFAPDIID